MKKKTCLLSRNQLLLHPKIYNSNGFYLIVLMLYAQVNNFSVMSANFLGGASTTQRIKCLAQGHNTVPPMRLKPVTPQSQVEHSTTELVTANKMLGLTG